MGFEPGACLSNLLPPGWGLGGHPVEADRRAQSQEASPWCRRGQGLSGGPRLTGKPGSCDGSEAY